MHSKLIYEANGERPGAVVFDTGDEVMTGLQEFASLNDLSASHFTAVSAFSHATLAYFDWEAKA